MQGFESIIGAAILGRTSAEEAVSKATILYLVQRAMFCPGCEIILDARSARLVTVTSEGSDIIGCPVCAGVFGRVDMGDGFATLTVGQMGLDGKGRRVVARRVEMNTAAALPPMELGLQQDRLQLRFGPNEVSTLADQIPAFLSNTARFGLRGEQCKVLHLSAQVLTPTAEDRALVEAETYLGAGRNDQALPTLAELAALSFCQADRGRRGIFDYFSGYGE
jgi:hypothetical protein